MKEIKRDLYLNRLISKQNNGMIKVITGLRRSGKSYLLDPLFKNHLLDSGVPKDHIIKLELDRRDNLKYLNPDTLNEYVMSKIKDNEQYYILLDEIQKVTDFESVLNGFLYEKNLDVYVTGSNSKFLSSDIITEFRGRGDEIRIYPLSFSEYFSAVKGDKRDAFNEYIVYGGMPYTLNNMSDEEKSKYLIGLFENTYLNDIIERNHIQRKDVLDIILNIISTSIGSLTNPKRISDTFNSNGEAEVTNKLISTYLDDLTDAFLIEKAERYDIKGRKMISTPFKYYFTDIGLRNARLNFREQDEDHLMENIIYNELLIRGYNVDVGVVEIYENDENGKTQRKKLEVDFVCNLGRKRYYIQSAFSMPDKKKVDQETESLKNINDSFKKIIIVRDDIKMWQTDDGILIMNIINFLLDPNSLDL